MTTLTTFSRRYNFIEPNFEPKCCVWPIEILIQLRKKCGEISKNWDTMISSKYGAQRDSKIVSHDICHLCVTTMEYLTQAPYDVTGCFFGVMFLEVQIQEEVVLFFLALWWGCYGSLQHVLKKAGDNYDPGRRQNIGTNFSHVVGWQMMWITCKL